MSLSEKRKLQLKEYKKKYYSDPANLPKRRQYIRDYVNRYPTRRLHANAKHRAKVKGIEFDLGFDDIVIPETCPILGIPIEVGAGKQEKGTTYKPNFATLDRIDPTKGYTKDNVLVVSFLANSMKRDATPEQLIAFADWIYKNYNKEKQKDGN